MLGTIVILSFIGILIGCLALDISIVYAMAAGYLLFFFYSLSMGYTVRDTVQCSLSGMKTVKNLLVTFLLIGMLTALWRASGTIPVIICYAVKLIQPSVFLLLAFLLNCLLSVLTGTSFGTVATMGVICMTMAEPMGIPPVYLGGAILSGIFFGDRCSPLSTSALLVSEVTGSDLYENIRGMVKTAVVPFLISCCIYLVLGIFFGRSGTVMDMKVLFERGFALHWILVLPALLILILAAFRIRVKQTLLVSILAAAVLGMTVQHLEPGELARIMFFGYTASDPELASMMNGGGVLSMVSTSIIVGLSSAFAGIFEATGLLKGMKQYLAQVARKATSFGAVLLTAAVTCMLFCNQTLPVILTTQLCRDIVPDKKELALYLENTAIVIAPLIPWSIACAVPLATIGAPVASILFACYLYLIPVWNQVLCVTVKKC